MLMNLASCPFHIFHFIQDMIWWFEVGNNKQEISRACLFHKLLNSCWKLSLNDSMCSLFTNLTSSVRSCLWQDQTQQAQGTKCITWMSHESWYLASDWWWWMTIPRSKNSIHYIYICMYIYIYIYVGSPLKRDGKEGQWGALKMSCHNEILAASLLKICLVLTLPNLNPRLEAATVTSRAVQETATAKSANVMLGSTMRALLLVICCNWSLPLGFI